MFPITNCGKCGGKSFGATELSPQDSSYKVVAVQCLGCGTPIGITDYYNSATLIHQQTAKLTELDRKIDDLQRKIRQIGQQVDRLAK